MLGGHRRVGQHRHERAGGGRDGGDVDQCADHAGIAWDYSAGNVHTTELHGLLRPRPEGRGSAPVAGVEDANRVDDHQASATLVIEVARRTRGVGAGGEPAQHIDEDVGGAVVGAVHPDRQLAAGPATNDGQVRDTLAGSEVEQRRRAGRARRVGGEPAGTAGVVDGDADRHREHIRCRRRNSTETEQLNVERGLVGPERLGACGGDIVDRGRGP